ncbi:MAG TPA: hypothetical protein VK821_07800 [Dehalococcoidia bacterium]|nr:hypothetical protein [Dehalococcoidia bacterium]
MHGFAVLTLEFHREGRLWVGECRELGTATDGRSLSRVEDELTKLITIHLNGLEADGERDRLFAERGIKLYTDQPPHTVERELPVSTGETLIELKSIPVGKLPQSAPA